MVLSGVEAEDSLYCCPVDMDRGMFTPLLSEVNSQLLCFADVEGEVVVVTNASDCSERFGEEM